MPGSGPLKRRQDHYSEAVIYFQKPLSPPVCPECTVHLKGQQDVQWWEAGVRIIVQRFLKCLLNLVGYRELGNGFE